MQTSIEIVQRTKLAFVIISSFNYFVGKVVVKLNSKTLLCYYIHLVWIRLF